MSPIPRDISPELVLVDPELAAVARRELPDPGVFAKVHAADAVAARIPTEERHTIVAADRRGWGAIAFLTLAAVSLTLNGVWLAQVLGHGTSPSARAAADASFPARQFNPLAPTSAATTHSSSRPTVTVSASDRSRTHNVTKPARKQAQHAHRTARNASGKGAKSPAPNHERGVHGLQWQPVAHATYYNVVLWRDGKRILDLWPRAPRVELPATSADHGPHKRLSPGRYLWFVYPGFGTKPSRHYGALAGSGVLIVQP